MKKIAKWLSLALCFIVALGVVNAYVFVPELQRQGISVVYRGGGSLVNYNKIYKSGCTATSLLESNVNTVENTLEAVADSVNAGVDVIHLNVHKTSDDQLVVFHDWTLDCATNATGVVNQSSFKYLENVDAGFGYTFDDGKTFPFRGQGFRISKLEEFYNRYPNHKYWLNLKSNDENSFNRLYTFISNIPAASSGNTMVITSPKGIDWFNNKDSSIRAISVNSVKKCGIEYLLMGWAGVVPESCRNTALLIPSSMTKYFWGYPRRLASRLQEHGSDVYIWSKHQPIDLTQSNLVVDGVGAVTSNLDFISEMQAKKRVN